MTGTFMLRCFIAALIAVGLAFGQAERGVATEADFYRLVAVEPSSPPPIDGRVGATWLSGAHVALKYDLTYRKGIGRDTTDAYVLVDPQYIYVAFVCKQREPLTVTQHTDDVGGGDDNVRVALWPGGRNGFLYTFVATPNGTHYQSSSENTAFAPGWDSSGRVIPGGYEVTMRIPRNVLHGDGRASWQLQFDRYVARNNRDLAWAFDPAMNGTLDAPYVGQLQGIGRIGSQAAARPLPRIGVYALAQAGAPSAGGNASRAGLDFSIPITGSSAFFGTVHPDYSDVEVDQQSISPTIFARRYNEVRPFFTQSANFFSSTELYTPSIPTPRAGYAVDGNTAGFRYAAFNALGNDGRDDNAETFGYTTNDQRWSARVQRVAVTYPGLDDVTQSTYLSYSDTKHWDVSGFFDAERGTQISDPSQSDYASGSIAWHDPQSSAGVSLFRIGGQFAPVDGYVSYNGTAGYSTYANHIWRYSSSSPLQSIWVGGSLNVSHAPDGSLNLGSHGVSTDITTRNNNTLGLSSGSLYVAQPGHGLVPFNQNSLGYYNNADPNKGFGITYTAGAIFDGYAQDLDVGAYAQLFRGGSVSIERYATDFNSPLALRQLEKLERISFMYQAGRFDAFSIGLRTIAGAPAGFGPQPQSRGTNLSFSYGQHRPYANLFVVYGDPNALSTAQSFVVKLVRFIGAGQGT